MKLSDTCIKRPILTIIMVSAIVLFGVIGYSRIGVDQFPDVEWPIVTVNTFLAGASPEVVETDVTEIIEEKVNEIEGVKAIRSISSIGVSLVTVEFVLEKDVDIAVQEVRDKVSVASIDLPRDVTPPIIDKMNIQALPFMWIAVTGTRSYKELSQFAYNTLRRRLETVPGVASVMMGGFLDREIKIWLDREKLNAHNLTAIDVTRAIKNQHLELPSGRLETPSREIIVKTMGEFQSPEEFENLIVAFRDNTPIRIRNLGSVEDGLDDTEEQYRNIVKYNGLRCIGLGPRRQSGANLIAVADEMKKRLKEVEKELPEGIKLDIAIDNSTFIKRSIHGTIKWGFPTGGVQFDLLLGVFLTILVIGFFLKSFAPIFISAIAIPACLIGTFAFMYFFDFTMNNISMMALSISVGLVVDNAIMILENIFRHTEEGEESEEAAKAGTSEIAFAVISATFTICAVFLPVAFMGGVVGRFFFQFGITVTVAVLLSLVISLTLTPMMCAKLIKVEGIKTYKLTQFIDWILNKIDEIYTLMLSWALSHRTLIICGIAIPVLIISVFMGSVLKREFITEPDQSQFRIRLKTALGASMNYTDYYLKELERISDKISEVKTHFGSIGSGVMGTNEGVFFVDLYDRKDRKRSQREIMAEMRQKSSEIPGTITAVENITPFGGGARNADVEYILKGPDIHKLAEYSQEIVKRLEALPGTVDVDTDLELTRPETRVYIDRNKAGDLGIPVSVIATTLGTLIGGQDVVKYKEHGKGYDVNVRLREDHRSTPMDISNIYVPTQKRELIPLSNITHTEETVGPQRIRRYDRERAVSIYANVIREVTSQGELIEEVDRISNDIIPKGKGYSTDIAGRAETMVETFKYMFFALFLAIIIIYMVLAAQFESFFYPLTIMLSLPLSLIGAFGGLLLAGQTLNMFSMIGLIMMMGLVTKNAILLVDYTNTLKARGNERYLAVLTAGRVRLRPILMTTFTTIFGIIPIALGLTEGGEQRAPLGVAVVFGMAASTLLTLVIIPVVYSLFDDIAEKIKMMWSRIFIRSTV